MLNVRKYTQNITYWLPIVLCFSIPISTALTTTCVLLLTVGWLLGGNIKQKLNHYWQHPLTPFLLGLLGLHMVGCFYSYANHEHLLERMSDGLRLCLVPVIGYYIYTHKQVKYSLYAFILAMIVTIIAGVAKVYLNVPIGQKYTQAAVFKSHIDTSFFMALAAFYVLCACMQYPTYRRAGLILGMTMLYYIFFMSIGRIGYFAIFILSIYLAYHFWGKKGLLITLGGLTLCGFGLYELSDTFSGRVDVLWLEWSYYEQGRLALTSLGSRIQFYSTSLALILQKPLLGWGTGSFGEAYYTLSQGQYLFTDNPHNEFLRIGVELGLVGLGLLIMLFVRQWQLYSYCPKSWQLFAKGSLLMFISGCLLNSWLIDFSQSYFYVLLGALSLSTLKALKPGDLVEVPLH